jgi:nitrate/nitrite transporter NarK
VAEIAGGRLAGTVTGVTAAFWQLGSVTVPLVVGVVFQPARSFNSPFLVLAAGPLFGALCMFLVRGTRAEAS